MEQRMRPLYSERPESPPRRTHSRAKQSSAELAATSSIPAIYTNPSHQTPSPIHALPPLPFSWHKRSLSDGDAVLTETGRRLFPLFFSKRLAGVSLFGGSLGSLLKPVLCVGENHAQTLTASSSHMAQCSASGALT